MHGLTPEDLYALSEAELFRTVGRLGVERIAALAKVVSVPRDQVLTRRGDRAEAVYGVSEGVLHAEIPSPDGRHIEPISAPDVCGWPGLIYPYRHLVTVSAVTDCRVIEIPVPALRSLLDGDAGMRGLVSHQLSVLAIRRIDGLMALLEGQRPFGSVSGR